MTSKPVTERLGPDRPTLLRLRFTLVQRLTNLTLGRENAHPDYPARNCRPSTFARESADPRLSRANAPTLDFRARKCRPLTRENKVGRARIKSVGKMGGHKGLLAAGYLARAHVESEDAADRLLSARSRRAADSDG